MTVTYIKSLKYGNVPHYEWETELLEQGDGYVFVLGQYGRKLRHHTKQAVFTINNWAIEFFSSSHWFTVSADIVDGRIHQYYCNINQPAVIQGNGISFVDLDLDLICRDGKWSVVDEDEFIAHIAEFGYPQQLVDRTRQELAALQERIASGQFPFDGTIERLAGQIQYSR
ncbi:DUF402 domain-containing protein [Paenibacillus protaetiae]|uniref:DUF402 domain-containing protein n=1 Tax=Paenibacillus protaetiae TaxID=2509456 RepID=UPI001FC8FB85|nr:DUF402 domain-containing protein [Paenibacillus protaetiae]